MRKFAFDLFFLLPIVLFGQNVGIGTTSPHSSAVVEISSNNKGILLPQISLANINLATPLSSPATSLLVYNTNASVVGGAGVGYYSWNGSQWKKIILDGEGNVPSGSVIFKSTATAISGYTLKGKTTVADFQEFLGVNSGTWSSIPSIPTGNATNGHSAVWTGTEMLIWSGKDPSYASYENTGAKYNPATNTWSAAISVASAPVGRHGHSTVWDAAADRMLVWGGSTAGSASNEPSAFTNTGGIYNAVTNTWTAITTTAAPVARYNHSGVWTGTRMIVWGGKDGSTYYNNGSSYNPATNTWTAIAAAPISLRAGHACVWTGTRMVIWGGENGTNALNDGAMYDPVSNTWSMISATNAPVGISDAGVVWTGSEMIITGGNLNSFTSSRIYQYHPGTNTWDASFVSLPGNGIAWNGSLSRHSVCWTGSEVLIFGGVNFTSDGTNVCYKFNPSTNAITYYANSPVTRVDHSAVWTGSEMLLFGGRSSPATSYLSSGYRLDPLAGSANTFLFPIITTYYMFIKD
jgi:N-acetylneuraminic acid mutarotase